MKYKILLPMSGIVLIGLTVWNANLKSTDHKTERVVQSTSSISTLPQKPSEKNQVSNSNSPAPSMEYYESHFKTTSDVEIRLQMNETDGVLDPLVQVSNQRELTEHEREIFVKNLRKRQALLKILIEREADQVRERVRI